MKVSIGFSKYIEYHENFWTLFHKILPVKLQPLKVKEGKGGETFQKLSKWNSHSIIIYQSLIDKLFLLNERICLQSFNVAFLNWIPFVTIFSPYLFLSVSLYLSNTHRIHWFIFYKKYLTFRSLSCNSILNGIGQYKPRGLKLMLYPRHIFHKEM